TRPLSASTVALVTCGAAGGACTAGQPSTQPTAITRAAATAPENGAMTQGEMAVGAAAVLMSSRSGSALVVSALVVSTLASSGLACSEFACQALTCSVDGPASGSTTTSCGWVETSVASRSMVGGVRLARPDSGAIPAPSGLPAS